MTKLMWQQVRRWHLEGELSTEEPQADSRGTLDGLKSAPTEEQRHAYNKEVGEINAENEEKVANKKFIMINEYKPMLEEGSDGEGDDDSMEGVGKSLNIITEPTQPYDLEARKVHISHALIVQFCNRFSRSFLKSSRSGMWSLPSLQTMPGSTLTLVGLDAHHL